MKTKLEICREIEALFTAPPMPYEGDELYRIVSELVDAAAAPKVTLDQGPFEQSLIAVRSELARAVAKFPTWPTDPFHALTVVGEERKELEKAVTEFTYEPHKGVTLANIRAEATQRAAMAVRFLASIDTYSFKPSDQHTQA